MSLFAAACGGRVDGSIGGASGNVRGDDPEEEPGEVVPDATVLPGPEPFDGGSLTDASCTTSSGPDAWPAGECTCELAAVGDFASHVCTSCPGFPPDAGPDYDAGPCTPNPFVLEEETFPDGAPPMCSIGCVHDFVPPSSCDPAAWASIAASRCAGYPRWDVVPWKDRCVLRCLD
jgi:hypothetical protein